MLFNYEDHMKHTKKLVWMKNSFFLMKEILSHLSYGN